MADWESSDYPRSYKWRAEDGDHLLELVPVAGTNGAPYLFGSAPNRRAIDIGDFCIMSTPVTQALWRHVIGAAPSSAYHPDRPVDSISWDGITGSGGFLERINSIAILRSVSGTSAARFRLPSETGWEYAARGGPDWTDEFRFSGSNDIDEVAWYGRRFSATRRLIVRLLGWRLGWQVSRRLPKRTKPTHAHDVALKKPNQLGLYDMCGNVWEWCQDTCADDLELVPRDGSPFAGEGDDRRLRGGCHHNWDIHCTVSFRYGIGRGTPGGAIGFRLVLA